MEGDRKFQRGNLSKVQNLSEVQISEVQNLTEENKRKRKRMEFLVQFVLITVGFEAAFFKNAA